MRNRFCYLAIAALAAAPPAAAGDEETAPVAGAPSFEDVLSLPGVGGPHGITKPKERLAGMWHNWRWFARHLWDDEVGAAE
ncbi:MAG: hypothetical protein D6696_01015 [Acidobacteria bacterium]|nr:MAG: hypothetical protein D6696_01015 [Acidobacteriota bacterium]